MTRVVAALLAFAWLAGFAPAGAAGDEGTRDDVRVIRHDATIVLAQRVRDAGIDPKTIVVDRVAAANGAARVEWHAGAMNGIDGFARIYKRWWDRVERPGSPDGFDVRFGFAHADANVDAALVERIVRRPTEAESWLAYPGGNSYLFFSAVSHATAPVHVDAGTTLDVWFPFVLDPTYRYSLTIAHADPVIGPINGTLHDNVLHFVLPAFSIAPKAQIMGEIEGDPH